MAKLNHSFEVCEDHFVIENGQVYAGVHLIIDFFGASDLADPQLMTDSLRIAVKAAGATLLHIHCHHFGPEQGVSGVAVLAESHISVHTWPERDYAAFDVFMCGQAQPEKALAVLQEAFKPTNIKIERHLRGAVEHE